MMFNRILLNFFLTDDMKIAVPSDLVPQTHIFNNGQSYILDTDCIVVNGKTDIGSVYADAIVYPDGSKIRINGSRTIPSGIFLPAGTKVYMGYSSSSVLTWLPAKFIDYMGG